MDYISKSNAFQCYNPLQGAIIDTVSTIQINSGALLSGLRGSGSVVFTFHKAAQSERNARLCKPQMVGASALLHLSLSPPLLLHHSQSYKLLMSHNLCMAMIRFNEVPTTLGWLSSAATRSLIWERAQLSLEPCNGSIMQANPGLSLLKVCPSDFWELQIVALV